MPIPNTLLTSDFQIHPEFQFCLMAIFSCFIFYRACMTLCKQMLLLFLQNKLVEVNQLMFLWLRFISLQVLEK